MIDKTFSTYRRVSIFMSANYSISFVCLLLRYFIYGHKQGFNSLKLHNIFKLRTSLIRCIEDINDGLKNGAVRSNFTGSKTHNMQKRKC